MDTPAPTSDSILEFTPPRQLIPLNDPLVWMFIDALSAVRDLPFEYARAWKDVNGPPPGHRGGFWGSVEPGLAYVSYNTPFAFILTFVKKVVDVPGYIDGLAKLIAYAAHFPDLIKTHEATLLTGRTQAEAAYEKAKADKEIERIQDQLRLAGMNALAVEQGDVQGLLVRARQIKTGS